MLVSSSAEVASRSNAGDRLRECLQLLRHVTVDPRCESEEPGRCTSRLVIIWVGQLERPSRMVRAARPSPRACASAGAEDRGGCRERAEFGCVGPGRWRPARFGCQHLLGVLEPCLDSVDVARCHEHVAIEDAEQRAAVGPPPPGGHEPAEQHACRRGHVGPAGQPARSVALHDRSRLRRGRGERHRRSGCVVRTTRSRADERPRRAPVTR